MVVAEGTPATASRIHGAALQEVEVALRVRLQVEHELVEVRGDLDVVVEVLVEVGFAVLVEVVQDRDLVATEDVDLLVDDLQAEAVEDAGGVAAPGDLAELVVGELADPDVAAPGGEGDASVLEEVDRADADPGVVGILGGDGDGVDEVGRGLEFGQLVLERLLLRGVGLGFDAALERLGLLGLVGLAERAFGDDFLRPVGGAALGEGAEVGGGGDLGGHFAEHVAGVDRAVGERDLEGGAGGDLGELEGEEVALVTEDRAVGQAVDGHGGEFVGGLNDGRGVLGGLGGLGLGLRVGLLAGLLGRERDFHADDRVGAVSEVDLAAVGQVHEADGGVELTLHDGEGAREDEDVADLFHLSGFEHFGAAD